MAHTKSLMLHINDLTYRIGPRLLFDSASAALPERARVGFVGRNGAGKTTLFRMISGEIEPEGGAIKIPRLAKMGRVEQEAPGGPQALIDFVLSADIERAALMAEAETASEPMRIADIQTRLADIDAHSAPARAASILSGLGFDHDAQSRALSEFSGGWRMRVALAAVLFSAPDILLLDEPTNYLDLEGALWLVDYLSHYPATVVVISHDRDLLDDVCDHILHLDQGKLVLWRGNYTSFEKQRREQQLVLQKQQKKQAEKRAHLQAFVDRFRASATKARQAQSRIKMLARMEDVGAIIDTDVLPFRFPSPARPLSPPIVTMERASAGYGQTTVLRGLDLVISNDDRIGLLGSNGNGKSTFAKLVAGRLDPLGGVVKSSSKLEVGFFAQHQIDDLDEHGTPFSHIAPLMPGETESRIRAACANIGFPGQKAETRITSLSGGEKARLLMGLSTFTGPSLVILDEPTNHLDIDSRAALIDAINAYEGAVILVSHDRRLLEACADRLWLVADGTVKTFDGDMVDYQKFVLDTANGTQPGKAVGAAAKGAAKPAEPVEKPKPRGDAGMLRRRIQSVDERLKKFEDLLRKIDAILADPAAFVKDPAKANQLAGQRTEVERALVSAEEEWLELTGELEAVGG